MSLPMAGRNNAKISSTFDMLRKREDGRDETRRDATVGFKIASLASANVNSGPVDGLAWTLRNTTDSTDLLTDSQCLTARTDARRKELMVLQSRRGGTIPTVYFAPVA